MRKAPSLEPAADEHFNSLLPPTPIDRRGFIAAALAAGFAVSAEPALGQAIRTPMDGLEGGEFRIGDMPAYFAVPRSGRRRPVVLVVTEIWGLHEYIRDICRRLAKAGYFAVANDPYYRSGELWRLTEIKEVLAKANTLADTQAFADLDATLAWAARHPRANARKLGITGLCRAGRTVWMYTAHSKRIKAAVAWYGSLMPFGPNATGPLDVADRLNAPVLGLYGGADAGIPLAHVERMRAALFAFGKDKTCQIHVYADAPHGFHADYRPSYREEAAQDGWARMLAWFGKHGVA